MASESKRGEAAGAKSGSRGTGARTPKRGGIAEMLSMDSERSARIMLFGAVGLVLAIAAAFLGFGYWYAEIRPEGRTVLEADGIKVSFAAMKRRMEYELSLNSQYLQSAQLFQVLPEVVYGNLLEELTVVSRAQSELDVSVTAEEIDARIRSRIGVSEDADARTFANAFREALDESRLSEAEYRRLVEADLLAEKIRERFTSQVPPAVEQAQLDVISVNDSETADQARARVAAGEDWATVARELSTDPNVAESGGRLPYQPEGALPQAFNDYAFDADPGVISEPLSTNDQGPFYIVRVLDRSQQPLTDDQKPGYVSRQYDQWITDTQAKMTVERHWELSDQTEALRDIDTSVAKPPQQPVALPTVVATAAAAPTVAADESAPDPSGAPQPNGQ
jgi:parvulin-like peptidyl-prolyl isomerase